MKVAAGAAEPTLAIGQLFCESGSESLGIDTPQPRLSWSLTSSRRGRRQTAYQVQVASSIERLARGEADLWDSGRVMSDQSLQVPYAGRALRSRELCFWHARVWDNEGEPSAPGPVSSWEMGLLSPQDWLGEWIGFTAAWPGRALYFRHVFNAAKPVRSARAYIAGLGYHELRLNGGKVGDHVLDPGWTDYSRRVLYVTHDITKHLQTGRNAVGVIVGHGWHGMPRLLLQIEIDFTDGTRQTIATRGGHSRAPDLWHVTSGPILENSVYDGETYDARLEKTGWDRPTDELPGIPEDHTEGWTTAVAVDAPAGALVAQMLEPIRVVETRRPVTRSEPLPGIFVFDAGQNLSGWLALRARGPRGTTIRLRFAESLREDGTIDDDNLRKARATDTYIMKGGSEETWEPRFTYHGFRYAQVEGWPGVPGLDDIQIRVVRSAVKPVGTFRCSNDLLDRIHHMTRWTEASNLHSVPTDCPQRDERMGWLNDMTVRIEPALYKFRLARFYAKWLDDVADTQAADGSITDTAPFKWGKRPADPVSASYLLLAWMSYLHFGDTESMRAHFRGFERWVDYLASRSEDGILSYSNWGDWAPPQHAAIAGSIGTGAISARTPGELISTGFLYHQADLLARMARILGQEDARVRNETLAARAAAAFNDRFWDEHTGGYGTNNQACNAFALFLGVVAPERVPRVLANLVDAVEQNDGHLDTGNLCTKYLLEMTTGHGRADVAFRIATQTTYPGWGYMLENGATTLWERWEHLTGGAMNSHNHPMLGSVDNWFFKYLAGIRPDEAGPGFRRFIVAPVITGDLTWVEASHESLRGTIRSAWRKEGSIIRLSVRVPVNATAIVHLPASAGSAITERGIPLRDVDGAIALPANGSPTRIELGSGDYEFEIE